MRFFLTAIASLFGSVLVGSMAGTLIAIWANGDESYILVFIAVPLAALVALVFFMIAWTRPVAVGAIDKVALFLAVLLALCLAALVIVEIVSNLSMAAARPGIELEAAMFASCLAAVVVQWLIFRINAGPVSMPPPAHFGRQGNTSNG